MLSDIQKMEIVANYKNDVSVKNIAILMDINVKTVTLWIKRYMNDTTVERKKRCNYNSKKVTTEIQDT
jgi:transposase